MADFSSKMLHATSKKTLFVLNEPYCENTQQSEGRPRNARIGSKWTGVQESHHDIEEVKFDTTRWANGTVRRYNPGQQGRPGSINVNFDDGTDNVRISFYDGSVNYVEPAFIERI
jgi:hypothetical protein